MLKRRIAPAVTAAALLFVAGCDSGPASKTTTPASPEASSTESTPTASPSSSPSVTPTAAVHKLGEKVTTSTGISANAVYAYRQPVAGNATRPQQAGYEWGAADVEVCATSYPLGVSHGPWLLTYPDHTTAEPSKVGYQQFPAPGYPFGERHLEAGRCVRGWITFAVPMGKRPALVEYAPKDETPVDWQVS